MINSDLSKSGFRTVSRPKLSTATRVRVETGSEQLSLNVSWDLF